MENSTSRSARTKGLILVLLSSLVYGLNPVASQLGYAAGLNSYSLVFGRYTVGIVIYFFLVLIKKDSFKITFKQFVYICLVTLFGYTCILLTFVSYQHLSAGMASLIGMTYIVFAVLFEIILRIAKGVWYKWVTLVLAFGGVMLITLSPGDSSGITTIGVVIGLIAAVLAAIQMILFNNKALKDLSIPQIFFYEMILPVLLTPFVAKVMGYYPFPVGFEQWGYAALVSVLNLGLGLMLFYSAIRLIGVGDASLVGVLEPVFAFVAGAIIFGDPITLKMFVGGGIILGAIFFMTLCQNRDDKKAAAAMADELEVFKAAAQAEVDRIIAEQEAKKTSADEK
ncbi:MAG: DMT family transporter [Firmicutes bacterium]|nr:DMT family transporter [Bacillota bacterium]